MSLTVAATDGGGGGGKQGEEKRKRIRDENWLFILELQR